MKIVVYPLTVQLDYTELCFSLRSIEKYLIPPFEIVIVGDVIPEWLMGITQIHLPDIPGRKQLSIRRKILAALEYAEEILFMNDDLFLLQPVNKFPYYWHGMLKNYSESGSKPLFKQLEAMGKPVKHFDGHYPLIYERKKFKEASGFFTEDCIIKSLYCNYHKTEGIFIPDCKVLKASKPDEVRNFIKGKPCFSTGAYSLQSSLPVLENLYPKKCNFEI